MDENTLVRQSTRKTERRVVYNRTFLYCLSLPSCVAEREESVAFREDSPDVSTRGHKKTRHENLFCSRNVEYE